MACGDRTYGEMYPCELNTLFPQTSFLSEDHHVSGFCNSIHDIRVSFLAGTSLPSILKKCDYYLEVIAKDLGGVIGAAGLLLRTYRETMAMLMSGDFHAQDASLSHVPNNVLKELKAYLQAIRA